MGRALTWSFAGLMITRPRETDGLDVIAAAAVGGDEQAFRALVERTSRLIYRLALRYVGSAAEAQDVVQDTYIKAWQNLSTLRDRGAVVGWLCRVCRNVATDRLRASRRRPAVEPGAADLSPRLDRVASSAPDPEERLARAEAGAAMAALLGELREKHRVVLLLHEVDGMTSEEIAVALGCPIGTVESRLHRARLALAGKLERAARRRAKETP